VNNITKPKDTQLTPRQREIFDYIKQRIDGGFPPTLREICGHTGIRSPNAVVQHLRALRKKGWIETDEHIARGIRLVNQLKPGELRDLEGNVHSFGDLFAEGNSQVIWAGQYHIYNSDLMLIGGIRFVGNSRD
jgi:SOS-response transcriptional repressor LexA